MTYGPTEKQATEAQAKILGRFCTRCRCHRQADGGRLLKAGSNRTRWVCATCLRIIQSHKRKYTNWAIPGKGWHNETGGSND